MATIPVSALYEGAAPSHYARFAFCKRPEVLDAAVERLAKHFGATGSAPLTGWARSA